MRSDIPRSAARLKGFVLDRLLPAAKRSHRIALGLWAGIRMNLSLRHSYHLWLGLYEIEIARHVRTLCRDVATCIDVGAGDGLYSLYFLLRTGARRVYAFEPNPTRSADLRANLALNGLGADRRLVMSDKAVARMRSPDAIALDDLDPELHNPVLLKVDIDGGELDLLEGANRLLRRPGLRVILETHSPRLERDCETLLRDAGLEPRIVPRPWWRGYVTEGRPPTLNQWIVAGRGTRENPGPRSPATSPPA
jgi:hypothetical protein